MRSHLLSELVLSAMVMALTVRRPQQVIHHSDQGTQYTSVAFGARCEAAGVRPSMGSVGDCYDNAMCESFLLEHASVAVGQCHLEDVLCQIDCSGSSIHAWTPSVDDADAHPI